MPVIESIITYPIKSTQGLQHQSIEVANLGLKHDRQWALFDDDRQCITGRDYPSLMNLSCEVTDTELLIHLKGIIVLRLPLQPSSPEEKIKIFSNDAWGSQVSDIANDWFSNYLNRPCRLLKSDTNGKRKVLVKHGGETETDSLGYADEAPVLIVSTASLSNLNDKLEDPIDMERFRPNIVIDDCDPHEEDQWSKIQVGDVQFKIIQPCVRCVFTTIDPITKIKHPKSEPLRTLATYRKGLKKGVIFGMHAVPLNVGNITIGDKIKVLQ